MVRLFRHFRQPWVAAILIALVGILLYLLMHHSLSVEKAAFLGAMAVAALMVSKSAVMMQSDAPATSFLAFVGGWIVFLAALNFTSAETFKDMLVEGLILQMAGMTGILIDEAIARSNRMRGIELPDKDA